MLDDSENFSLPADPAPGQWWPADVSADDLKRYGFYGGLVDAVDRHTAATGSPPDDDQLLAYGRKMADQHGVNLDGMLGLKTAATETAATTDAAAADTGTGQQVAAIFDPSLLCDGGQCHTLTPRRPVTPAPPILRSPPASQPDKDYCFDRCTALALPTLDYGVSFQRCRAACQSRGNSGFDEWDFQFR